MDSQDKSLSKTEYLEMLSTVADHSAPAGDRKAAKARLIEAHMHLIAWAVNNAVKKLRPEKGVAGTAIGIEDFSDLLNSAARGIFSDLTKIAVAAEENDFAFSTLIVPRVQNRVIDKIRRLKAAKRTAEFVPADELNQLSNGQDHFQLAENMILKEAFEELRSAIELLSETERNVLLAMVHATERGEFLTVTEVARVLEMPPTTVRCAYNKAKEKLREWLSDDEDSFGTP